MTTPYLEVAERIGARLCRNALWSRGRCNWTADRAEGRTTIHASLGPHLYDGTSGIALFLWRLAEVTGERIFRLTAEAALRHALSKLPLPCTGFYAGAPGILLAASQMGREIAEAQALEAAALRPEMLDLIAGSAGAIIALLCLYRAGGNARLLETAVSHGDLVLRHATRAEEGWSPEGRRLHTIGITEVVSSLAFGEGDMKTLFLTARALVLRARPDDQ